MYFTELFTPPNAEPVVNTMALDEDALEEAQAFCNNAIQNIAGTLSAELYNDPEDLTAHSAIAELLFVIEGLGDLEKVLTQLLHDRARLGQGPEAQPNINTLHS